MQRLPGYRAPKGAVVHDERELDATLRTVLAAGVDVLVTEIIPGGDDRYCSYYSHLDEQGEPLLHFTKRKPRQYPIGCGRAPTTSPSGARVHALARGCGSSRASACGASATSSPSATPATAS